MSVVTVVDCYEGPSAGYLPAWASYGNTVFTSLTALMKCSEDVTCSGVTVSNTGSATCRSNPSLTSSPNGEHSLLKCGGV